MHFRGYLLKKMPRGECGPAARKYVLLKTILDLAGVLQIKSGIFPRKSNAGNYAAKAHVIGFAHLRAQEKPQYPADFLDKSVGRKPSCRIGDDKKRI